MWKNLNNLKGVNESKKETIKLELNGKVTEEGKTVANAFNHYFCNIGIQLAATIPRNVHRNDHRYVGNSNSIYLRPATEQEVILRISKLDNSKSPGPDDIPAHFVKANHTILAPLIRDEKKTDCSNYRPISILSVFSKILEQLIADRVSQLLKHHNIEYRGSSTLTAASELVDAIHNALDNRKFMGVLFLDLKKAFETIDQTILLRKLESCGIRECSLSSRQSANLCSPSPCYATASDREILHRFEAHSFDIFHFFPPTRSISQPELLIEEKYKTQNKNNNINGKILT
ncbi:uncharacterized protein LOC129743057 [Uranotaenia lowii]|uniref:uncharacterized protein LOC129743057 n=1 Tax=Uranotaenia lowii TaxID=190385 RepID=UPI00247B20F4|nr:uncharacterized protein LOC129743057 [Uranotaenia lowii]